LILLLLEAHEKIAVYFLNPEVSLEVITDPETEGDYQLLASVSTSLARLYREWDAAAAICPQCRSLAGLANTVH
jgi:hypothetical protein